MRGATLGLMLVLAVTTPARSQEPIAHDARTDTVLVRYAGMVVLEHLAQAMSAAAHDSTRHWWKIRLPTSPAPALWENLRGYLTKVLYARDSVATDSAFRFVAVDDVRIEGNVMTFTVVIGGAHRCREMWLGNDQAYHVRSEREGTSWMWPRVSRGAHGYSPSCR